MTSLNRYYRRRQRGLTLVEVVAASALLGTLMVSMLLAYRGHRQQLRIVQGQLQAIAAADRLLQKWGPGAQQIPRNQIGIVVESANRWQWRTTAAGRHALGRTVFDVVRLEIHQPEIRRSDARPLAAVDVLVGSQLTSAASPPIRGSLPGRSAPSARFLTDE